MNRTRKIGKFLKPASALLLAALVLCLSVVGAGPSLHRLIHADASSANHTCVVMLFAKGQISPAPSIPILNCFVSHLMETRPLADAVEHSVFDVQLAGSRAPPSC